MKQPQYGKGGSLAAAEDNERNCLVNRSFEWTLLDDLLSNLQNDWYNANTFRREEKQDSFWRAKEDPLASLGHIKPPRLSI